MNVIPLCDSSPGRPGRKRVDPDFSRGSKRCQTMIKSRQGRYLGGLTKRQSPPIPAVSASPIVPPEVPAAGPKRSQIFIA